jgi:hypothetical protein
MSEGSTEDLPEIRKTWPRIPFRFDLQIQDSNKEVKNASFVFISDTSRAMRLHASASFIPESSIAGQTAAPADISDARLSRRAVKISDMTCGRNPQVPGDG